MKPNITHQHDGWIVRFKGVKYGYGPFKSIFNIQEMWEEMIESAKLQAKFQNVCFFAKFE